MTSEPLVAADATLLGLAAIVTALSGIVTAIWGALKSRREGKDAADETLRDRLRECRDEAEGLAQELHRVKMRRFDHES